MLAIVALAAPSTPRIAPLNATDTLRVQLEREVQTLGRPDPPGGAAGGYRRTAKKVNGKVRSSAGGTEEASSATSKLRSAVAADVQRMLTDVERMGKTEEDEMSMLRTKAHVPRMLKMASCHMASLVAPRLGRPARMAQLAHWHIGTRRIEAFVANAEFAHALRAGARTDGA